MSDDNTDVQVTSALGVNPVKNILEFYNNEIDKLDDAYHTTSGILYSCVLAVVNHCCEYSNEKYQSKDKDAANISDIFLPNGDFVKLSAIGSNGIFQSLLNSNDHNMFGNDIITSEADDLIRYSAAKSAIACHTSIEGLNLFKKHALIRSQINTLLLDNKFQLKPEMTSTERGIKETEILSFTSLSTSDLYRNDQLQAFSEMLKSHVQILPNFTGTLKSGDGEEGSILRRRYFRQIPASTFAQILIAERIREPVVIKEYYNMTDDLLYALHWPPPERRINKASWVKVLNIADPNAVHESVITDTKKKKKLTQTKKKSGGKIEEVDSMIAEQACFSYEIKTTTLTPAAHSLALIKKSNLSPIPWFSIYINGSILGLRVESNIDPELDDNKSIETSNTLKSSSVNGDRSVVSGTNHSIGGADLNQDQTHSSSHSLLPIDDKKGVFFCHTEDDVRFITCAGPLQPNKPDGFSSACLMVSYTDQMIVTICTNGITKISIPLVLSSKDGAGIEIERFIGIGGVVMSIFSKNGPSYGGVRFKKEIKEPNGNRLLIRWLDLPDDEIVTATELPLKTHLNPYHSFYEELCSSAPEAGWTCVQLGANGSATFYFGPTDSNLLDSSQGISHSSLNNKLKKTIIDAETKSLVSSFIDGRLIICHNDGRIESRFGDGTVITTHNSGSMISVLKPNLPGIEIDVEIDSVSRQHARGVEVPINKGGDRVRSRIALPDGSAAFVKYNTLLTATSNGSIKLVRRDKTSIVVADSGVTTYLPRTAWNQNASLEFSKDCADFDINPIKVKEIMSASSTETKSDSVNFNPNNALTASLSTKTKARTIKKINSPNIVTKPPINLGSTVEDDLFVDKKEKDVSITIDYKNFTCKILDHQYNSFDINLLQNALDPTVILSGEVDGLKPPAVADRPMDPRLFIVSRSADATELLSIQNVTNMETLLNSCSDVKKILSKVELKPSDLGTSNQHQYFIQRRLLGLVGDSFTFEEVFGSRQWHPSLDNIPAAALHFIRKEFMFRSPNQENGSATIPPPRYYEKMSLNEQNPLSIEGHAELRKAIKRCEEFRSARLLSIDRFKVEEDRSKEELDEEEALGKRLKLAFKTAKAMAAKKKEQKARDISDNSSVNSSIAGGTILNKHIQGVTIIENLNEDAEEDDESASFYEDEAPEEVLSTEELEIKETFHDFALQGNNHHEEAFYISKDDLQNAYIRLFNRYIPPDLILSELDRSDDYDPSFKEFTFIEFRNIYYSIKNTLSNPSQYPSSSKLLHSDKKPMITTDDIDNNDTLSHCSEHSINSPTYWQSAPGKSAITSLPAIGPPLDFRKLQWDEDSEIPSNQLHSNENESEQLNERMISTATDRVNYPYHPAVGSAFQVIRNRALTAPERK